MEPYSGVLYKQLMPANIPEPWKQQCHSLWNKFLKLNNHHMKNQNTLPFWKPSQRKDQPLVRKTHSFLFSPNFPTPYIHNQDFGDTDKALKYIMKVFNLQVIHNSLLAFPTLSRDIVYYGTYIDSDRFTTKQNQQIDLWLQCPTSNLVRTHCQILCIWQY